MKHQCEKLCWHFSGAKYIGHLGPKQPPEYFRTDKYDPYQTNKYPTFTSVPLTIVGDTIDPVYPSPYSHREIDQYVQKLHQKFKAPNQINPLLIMKAVFNINSGQPLNPRNEKSLSQAAIGLTAELEGDHRADIDKSALDTSHVFANILDPGYAYPGDRSVCTIIPATPLARYSRSTTLARDTLESSPSNTSTIGDDPATLIGQKMGRNVFPFDSPSTTSSTPSRASILAMELPPDVSGSSTGAAPLAPPKEVERVKRQLLQTGQGHRPQEPATTPQGVEGAQQLATAPGGGDRAQQLATTPGGDGAQQQQSGSRDQKRKAEEEGHKETKCEKIEEEEGEEEDDIKLLPLP